MASATSVPSKLWFPVFASVSLVLWCQVALWLQFPDGLTMLLIFGLLSFLTKCFRFLLPILWHGLIPWHICHLEMHIKFSRYFWINFMWLISNCKLVNVASFYLLIFLLLYCCLRYLIYICIKFIILNSSYLYIICLFWSTYVIDKWWWVKISPYIFSLKFLCVKNALLWCRYINIHT